MVLAAHRFSSDIIILSRMCFLRINGDSLIIKALWSLDLLSGSFTFSVVSIWQLQKRKVSKTYGTFQTLIHYNSKIIFWDFKRWELSAIAFKGLVGERCRNSHVVFAYRIGISSAYKGRKINITNYDINRILNFMTEAEQLHPTCVYQNEEIFIGHFHTVATKGSCKAALWSHKQKNGFIWRSQNGCTSPTKEQWEAHPLNHWSRNFNINPSISLIEQDQPCHNSATNRKISCRWYAVTVSSLG